MKQTTMELTLLAKRHEESGDIQKRNSVALKIFNEPGPRITPIHSNLSVETWYDCHSKNWVTQAKDAKGNQIGDSQYSGGKLSAAVTHLWTLQAGFSGKI